MERLQTFIGAWEMRMSVDGRQVGRGTTTFEWMEGGPFLLQHSDGEGLPDAPREWIENAPFPVASIIGFDDVAIRFSMLYSDARGVFRIYQMEFEDGHWRMWRDAPGFSQRFSGVFSDDRAIISGYWETSLDGETWQRDFDLMYLRQDA